MVNVTGVTVEKKSLCEELGGYLGDQKALRFFSVMWLVPAAWLIWTGFAAVGLRQVDEAALLAQLRQVQAGAIALALITFLVGVQAAIRHLPAGPIALFDSGRLTRCLGAAGTALVLLAAGLMLPAAQTYLFALAATAGFATSLGLAYSLYRIPSIDPGPLAALVAVVGFQLTVGWLHLVHSSMAHSPVLIVEGVLLAISAAAAARTEPLLTWPPVATEPKRSLRSLASASLDAESVPPPAARADMLVAEAARSADLRPDGAPVKLTVRS